MQEKRNLVCIVCPVGCHLEIQLNEKGVESVSGFTCKRGKDYAVAECINPVRTLTSVVKVTGGNLKVVPVKSHKPIPKNLLFDFMKEINRHSLQAPVKIGDIVIENVLDTGINIIATSNITAE